MAKIESADPSINQLKGIHLWHAPMSSCSQRVRITLAEMGFDYHSHVINLEKDEHASAEYQKIHPKGLVPALVDNGDLIIESIDIISHIAGADSLLAVSDDMSLLKMADEAQLDLKLLTFEFLFRMAPPPPEDAVKAFQQTHKNDWLKEFRIDFANGFKPERIDAAIARTDAGFKKLDTLLSDGRTWLAGDKFSLVDIAWMPNVHRFRLMDWPFERTPSLESWFSRVRERPSYTQGLLDWQKTDVAQSFAAYTKRRQVEGTDLRSFPHFASSNSASGSSHE